MKVISFCIYGSNNKYCKGLDENLKLIQINLTDYNAFIYVGDNVPDHWISTYKSYQFVKLIYTERTGHDNMINRFFAIDHEDVDIAIIRDADSRLHERDIWCIKHFETSSYKFHTIRDHPEHRALILGGLWGIKKGCIDISIQDLYKQFNSSNKSFNIVQHDQYFLRDIVYPLVYSNMIVYAFNERMKMLQNENLLKIPLEVINDNFCGLAIKYDESGNEIKEYKWNYGYECIICKKFCGPNKCGKCGQVIYCSRECQVNDWQKHKLTCFEIIPLVSVIIPTYNRFKYVLNAIDSVKKQTYKNIEIIVVNDRSTEAEYYSHDFTDNNIKIIHHEKNSREVFGYVCSNYPRNTGLLASKGKYIAFLDDDIWLPNKLELQVEMMNKTKCKMSCTEGYIGSGIYTNQQIYKKYNSEYFLNDLRNIYARHFYELIDFPDIWDYNFLKIHNCVITSSVLIDKKLLIDNNCIQYDKNGGEDYKIWLRALQFTKCCYIKSCCFYYDDNHGLGRNY